jgi:hypothetical protein
MAEYLQRESLYSTRLRDCQLCLENEPIRRGHRWLDLSAVLSRFAVLKPRLRINFSQPTATHEFRDDQHPATVEYE